MWSTAPLHRQLVPAVQVYNPGLREAIKEYSAWPTIPQLYVDGEFVGGSDITEEMFNNGQLAQVLRKD